jgi:hypothetical protein
MTEPSGTYRGRKIIDQTAQLEKKAKKLKAKAQST